jgi:hypothetical protein
MKKSGAVILVISLVAILMILSFSLSFVSASWLFDVWNKITGNAITGKAISGPTDGLIAYYPFDNDANDYAGANNFAIASNGSGNLSLNLVSGVIGKAYHSSGNVIMTTNNIGISGNSPRTISLWVKTNSDTGNRQGIIGWGIQSSQKQFVLEYDLGNSNSLYFCGYAADLASNKLVNDNVWHHAVVSYDGSAVKLYIDNVLDGSFSPSPNLNTIDSKLLVGSWFRGYIGDVDDVRIYNRVLSASEIQQLYTLGNSGGGNQTNQTIRCYSNSDCGTSTTTSYCSGASVCTNGTQYTCNNAGTSSSYCSTNPIVGCASPCANGCLNGACVAGNQTTNNFSISSCRTLNVPGAYKLTADIYLSLDQPCLIINTSNVILDFANHLIDSNQLGSNKIAVEAVSKKNVTIMNMRANNINHAVHLKNVTASSINNNNFLGSFNGYVLYLEASDKNIIENNNFMGCVTTIGIQNSNNNDISGNYLFSDGGTCGGGIFIGDGFGGSYNKIINNKLFNGNIIKLDGYGGGLLNEVSYNQIVNGYIEVSSGSNNNISNNVVYGSDAWGLYVVSEVGSSFVGNSVYNNSLSGLYVLVSSNNSFGTNKFCNNAAPGSGRFDLECTSSENNFGKNNMFSTRSRCAWAENGKISCNSSQPTQVCQSLIDKVKNIQNYNDSNGYSWQVYKNNFTSWDYVNNNQENYISYYANAYRINSVNNVYASYSYNIWVFDNKNINLSDYTLRYIKDMPQCGAEKWESEYNPNLGLFFYCIYSDDSAIYTPGRSYANSRISIFWHNENVLSQLSFYSSGRLSDAEIAKVATQKLNEFINSLKDNKWSYNNFDEIIWRSLIADSFWEDLEGVTDSAINMCPSKSTIAPGQLFHYRGCKTEPIICPPHGYQTKTCYKNDVVTGESQIVSEQISCSPGICSGCYTPRWLGGSDNKCIPYGFRFALDSYWDWELREGQESDIVMKEREGKEVSLEYIDADSIRLRFDWNNETTPLLKVGDSYKGSFPDDKYTQGYTFTLTVTKIVYSSQAGAENYVVFDVYYSYLGRIVKTLPAYCDIDGWVKMQKSGAWEACQNNYECASNICSYGECVDLKGIAEQANAFKATFVKVICRLSHVFNNDDYNTCVYKYLGEEEVKKN